MVVNSELLQGEWVHNNNRILSFWDTLVSNPFYDGGQFVRYRIIKDTVFVNYTYEEKEINKFFTISNLNKDTLIYILDSVKYELVNADNIRDTTVSFNEIQFASTINEGWLPVIKLTIYEDGKVYFYGEFNTPINGQYSGVLSKFHMQRLNSILGLIDLYNLKSHDKYIAPPGSQNYVINIKFNGNNERNYQGCLEMKYIDLFYRLLEIWKFADLQEDSTNIKFIKLDRTQ